MTELIYLMDDNDRDEALQILVPGDLYGAMTTLESRIDQADCATEFGLMTPLEFLASYSKVRESFGVLSAVTNRFVENFDAMVAVAKDTPLAQKPVWPTLDEKSDDA